MKQLENRKPVINFIGYRVKKINYFDFDNDTDNLMKPSVDYKVTCNIEKRLGAVIINASLLNDRSSDNNFDVRKLELEMIGMFSIREDVSLDDAKKYLATNGSAMLYPYVRTTISILVSLDAPENIVMPSINFLEAYNESMDNKTEEIEFDDFNPRIDGVITAYSHEDDKTYEFSLYLSYNDYGDVSITIDSNDDHHQSRTINEAFNRYDVITSDSPTEEELNREKKLEEELKSNVEEQIKEMIHEMIEE